MEAERGLDATLKRIEAIVFALDSDSLGLDEALALFEEGVGHLRRAQEFLALAELRVEELIGREGEEVREFREPGQGDRDAGDDS